MAFAKKSLAALLMISVGVFAAAIIAPPPAHGGPSVSGTVAAQQSGPWTVGAQQSGAWTVGAQQSGPWSVGVEPGTNIGIDSNHNTVVVGNASPILVRDADRQAEKPFQLQLHVTAHAVQSAGVTEFEVPAGYSALFEYVSAESSHPNSAVTITVHTTV